MDATLALMGQGFINAIYPINLLAMAAGTTIGIVIGCLPGLSAAMGVAHMSTGLQRCAMICRNSSKSARALSVTICTAPAGVISTE
ncbi:MAG: hypothetical protein IJM40_00015, partial [Synergistaceae bacterium]|nr:hypothetical protein [Synergistaceae bacterium]